MSDSKRDKESPIAREAAALERFAERSRREGKTSLAILLNNAAWLLRGGELASFDWSTRTDDKTDDITVTKSGV